MSVPRKLLGVLLGAVALATLVGVVVPANPASAEPQCRWEIDPPPECQPPPPVGPIVPPPMGPMEPAPTMTPQPGGPTAPPGETCGQAESTSTIVIRESGMADKPVYTMIVDFSYCYRPDSDGEGPDEGAITSATVTSRTVRSVPGDSRLRTVSRTRKATSSLLGGPRYFNVQEVFFTGCGDPMNIASCRNFRHVVQVGVTANGTLSSTGRLELFSGPLPPELI